MHKSWGARQLLFTMVATAALLVPLAAHKTHAQIVTDPGVRGGAAGAGGMPG